MDIYAPKYYKKFKCIADKCPDTCCAGWQIVIDEASLDRYEAEASSFGECLRDSIDWQEGVFYHKDNRRCTFLNEQNLCDLYTALGPDALCDTCRDYPRHTEEYEGLRELSLSLSCPVATKMILSEKKFPVFVEYETDEPEELADEFVTYIETTYPGKWRGYRNGRSVDLPPYGISKVDGIQWYLSHFGGEEPQIYTVGDNVNDIPMLEAFPSYAVATGVEKAKAAADHICDTVASMLEELL